jgi:hypothetical protein
LKHGLYAGRMEIVPLQDPQVRNAAFAILYLEQAIDEIHARLMQAEGDDFPRLANSLSLAVTALFNGHRAISFLTGGMSPMEDALNELKALNFSED